MQSSGQQRKHELVSCWPTTMQLSACSEPPIIGFQCVQAAPNKVIQNLQRAYGGLRDDTSLVVLDIMPPGVTFSQLAQSAPKQQGGGGGGGGGGGCFCFAAS